MRRVRRFFFFFFFFCCATRTTLTRTSNKHLRVQPFTCSDYSCTAKEKKRGQPLWVRASATALEPRVRRVERSAHEGRELWITSRVLETQEWRDAHGNKRRKRRGGEKKVDSCRRGRRGGGATSSLAKRHVNGEWRASLNTFSHRANFFVLLARWVSRAAVAVCFLRALTPPPPASSFPPRPSFSFLSFAVG